MYDWVWYGSVPAPDGVGQRFGGSAEPFRRRHPRLLERFILAFLLSLTRFASAAVLQAAEPIHEYVFLIDTSASMERENKLVASLRVALDDFADTIPKDGTSRVWIFTFDSALGRVSLVRQLNRTEDLQEAKVFLNDIKYEGERTHIYQALDGVLAEIEKTVRDGKPHDFTIHLFTDGADNGPRDFSFEKNAERFKRLRETTGNALELYYHALNIEIPPKLAKVLQDTDGMYSIAGVGMPPKARFSPPKVDITDSTPVTFVDQTIGQVDSHEWDFGDGTVSKEKSPTHTFPTPGKYTVTLTASNPAGKSSTSKEVEVRGAPPQAKFAIHDPDKPKFVGEPVRFIDQSTGQITLRAWKFGDAAPRECATTETEFAFPQPGRIQVMLAVKGPFGQDRAAAYVTIEPRPALAFSFFPKEPVQQKEVRFINESKGSFRAWKWQFGDGATSDEMNPTHAYAKAGKYKVQLSGLDDAGASTEFSAEVVVGTGYVKPAAKLSLPVKTIGIGEELTLTDQSSGTIESWTWDMGDGTVIKTPTATHRYQKAGTYAIRLTVSGPAGSDNATASLVVKPATLSFSIRPKQPREREPVTFVNESAGNFRQWKWDFGDGTGSEEKNPEHSYEKPGQFTVTLEAMGPDEKTQRSKVEIQVEAVPLKADFALQVATVEIGQTLELTHKSTGNVQAVQWDLGDGTKVAGDTAKHSYAKPGTYKITLTVSDDNGSDSTSHTLTVADIYRAPKIAFAAAGPVKGIAPLHVKIVNACEGSIKTFAWEFGDGTTSDDRDPPPHTFANPGTYKIALKIVDQKDQVFHSTTSQNVEVEVLKPPPPPPPPRYPRWFPWVVAGGWYALAWLFVGKRWWPWSRRNVFYQQDGHPHRHRSWRRDLIQTGFQVVLCRTFWLRKIYRYHRTGDGVAARSLAGEISDGDRIRAGCRVRMADGKTVALGRLNDAAWTCLVPHALILVAGALLLVILFKFRYP